MRRDGGISLTVRNDASFVLDMNLSIYCRRLVKIPTPHFAVFAFANRVNRPDLELTCTVYNISQ